MDHETEELLLEIAGFLTLIKNMTPTASVSNAEDQAAQLLDKIGETLATNPVTLDGEILPPSR